MPICLEMVIMKLALKERDLDKIKDWIKNIQILLENHNCEVKYCEPIITNVDWLHLLDN